MEELSSIEKELESKAIKIEDCNFLFLDISSTCVGYTVVKLNFKNKTAVFLSAGAIWLPNTDHADKYNYMNKAILTYFDICHKIDYVIYEQYSINPKKMVGVNVCVEMIGSIRAALAECGIKHSSILPQTWRSVMKIKKTADKDFKEPTKQRVLEFVSVPEDIISNTTQNTRKTPSDLYDSLAIAMAWCTKMNFNKQHFDSIKIQEHVGVLNEN